MLDGVINFIKGFGVTTYFVLGYLGFEFYGASLLFMMYIIYIIFGMLDIMLGYYIAHKYNIVTSNLFNDGVMSKVIKYIIIGFIVLLFAHISYLSIVNTVDAILTFIGYVVIGLFLYGELLSIIENGIIISNGKNKVILQFFAKILGIGYDYVQLKIEKKVKEVTGDTLPPK